jgi:serine/threonine protein kinase
MRQFQFFGPFPPKYEEIADEDTVDVVIWLMEQIPRDKMTSFHRISDKEVCKKDKEFIGGIMKLDPRDRPTARELLEHEWFRECREKQVSQELVLAVRDKWDAVALS